MFLSLKLDHPVGVLINSVRQGSPAQAAGLVVGDVITGIDGREIDDPEALRYRVATKPVDATVRLTVMRSGKPMTIDARLTTPPDNPPRQSTLIDGPVPFAGATVANLIRRCRKSWISPGANRA